ncbi:MAG: hypothetical protein IIY72_06285 [Solobacterium sp.]|nr:hypothetical protein [Solobacterium sp.]
MLKITQIICQLDETLTEEQIARKLHCRPSDILSFSIERESLDARRDDLHYSYTVLADLKNEEKYLRRKDVTAGQKDVYIPLKPDRPAARPVIAGFGPAGMFAGLILAEAGMKPLIIERGRCVEERSADVQRFFAEGILDPESNVQYGEGGAGTFSDGKLTTRIKNTRIHKVLEEFVEAGADPAILYRAMPHLGTDQLQVIVRNIRNKIIRLGGEVRFETKLLSLQVRDGRVSGAVTNQGVIPCHEILLCLGHSAADTCAQLLADGLQIVPKDFAAGVRVEHPQALINQNQYGRYAGHPALGAASYRLSYTASTGRGVYSFCMCPGGVVVPASTAEGQLAVNGMSYAARDGKNANSAILVQIPQADFYHGDPLDGFRFQEELERNAYRDGFRAPAQNIRDYLQDTETEQWALDTSFPRGTESADMHELFSAEVNRSLDEGFRAFDRKIPGFIDRGIMVGMESRSSSPVRMPRDEHGQSNACAGVYPCGEGAGYAGGIISSAVDGIRQAEQVITVYRK